LNLDKTPKKSQISIHYQKAIVFVKKYLFYPISKNNLWKGAFILGSGTALAQLIGILTTPI